MLKSAGMRQQSLFSPGVRTRFARLLALIVGLLLAHTLAAPAAAQDPASDLFGRINALRSSLGLPAYGYSGTLAAAAQNHAAWMASTGSVSHTQSNGSTPSSRATAAGYPTTSVSENIYMGSSATVDTAWTWWLNSSIHYRSITNASFSEVGIASASGVGGVAYVLVFGSPTGWQPPAQVARTGGGSSSDAQAGAPVLPSFVVGVDSQGHIMHEIQPGQTLGDIALLYGYTWEIVPTMLAINGMTQDDIRRLDIGGVLLIPPWEGTYTPTPGDPPQETPTPPDLSSVPTNPPTHSLTDTPAVPTAPPSPTPTPTVIVPTPTAEANAQWTAATWTPTAPSVAARPEPATVSTTPAEAPTDDSDVPPALVIAVVLQIGFVLGAGFEYLRRRGR